MPDTAADEKLGTRRDADTEAETVGARAGRVAERASPHQCGGVFWLTTVRNGGPS